MTDTRYIPLDSLFSEGTLREMRSQPLKLLLGTLVAHQARKGGSYYVRGPDDTVHEVGDGTKACMMLMDLWRGRELALPNDAGIAVMMEGPVREFILGDAKRGKLPEIPLVDGLVMAPTAASWAVEFRGRRFLNIWRDTVMKGDPAVLYDARVASWVEMILKMIREALACCPESYDLETMQTRLHERHDDDLAFRFIMNWLAVCIQRPGQNQQTNLMLVGLNEGCGKGTMASLVRDIIGGRWCLTANAGEFKRGWSDQIEGRLMVILNDFVVGSKREDRKFWAWFAKTFCCEELVTSAKRWEGIGLGEVPNHTNYLCHDNCENPFDIAETDRRWALFRTTYDRSLNVYAETIQAGLMNGPDRPLYNDVLNGLAAIFHELEIEDALLVRPLETQVRDEIKTQNADPLIYFFSECPDYPRDRFLNTAHWRRWINEFHNDDQPWSAQAVSGALLRLANLGLLKLQSRPAGRTQFGKPRVVRWFAAPSAMFPKLDPNQPDYTERREERQNNVRQLILAAPSVEDQ